VLPRPDTSALADIRAVDWSTASVFETPSRWFVRLHPHVGGLGFRRLDCASPVTGFEQDPGAEYRVGDAAPNSPVGNGSVM